MVGEINFGLIDTSLPQKYAQPFARGQANRLALQQAEQERSMNALALQQKQQGMADEQAMRQAYAESGGDQNRLVEALRGAGQHQKAFEMQGQMAQQEAAARKAQIEQGLQKIQVIGQIASGVSDQASYDAARSQIAQIFGENAVAKIPAQYDPAVVQQFKTQALTAQQQAEQQWKALDAHMNQQKFLFERQKFGAQQGLEREKMSQSAAQFQATQGLEREKLAATKGAGKALTEGQAKATTYASQMQSASNEIDKIEEAGFSPTSLKSQMQVGMAGGMTNIFAPKDAQQYKQAQEQWAESFLRAKTGAAATKDEVELNRKTFFPQTGDSAAVVEQKRRARAQAEKDVLTMAGPGAGLAAKRTNQQLPGGWSVEEH